MSSTKVKGGGGKVKKTDSAIETSTRSEDTKPKKVREPIRSDSLVVRELKSLYEHKVLPGRFQ